MAKNKIMIVDDDRDLAFIKADTLESYGYEVRSAANKHRTYV